MLASVANSVAVQSSNKLYNTRCYTIIGQIPSVVWRISTACNERELFLTSVDLNVSLFGKLLYTNTVTRGFHEYPYSLYVY